MSSFEREPSQNLDSETIYSSLKNVSAIDGRDAVLTHELSPYLSEGAFHRYRAVVEIEALIALSDNEFPGVPKIDSESKNTLRDLTNPDIFDPKIVTTHDHIGWKTGEDPEDKIDPLEHDVKSVEIYLGELFDATGHSDLKEWIHFAVTSEDINNIALNLMLREAVNSAWLPQAISIMDRLADLAETHANTPVLGRTHLQPASPTTYGKRFATHLENMMEVTKNMSEIRLTSKFSGPVGNDNSMETLAPNFDYQAFAKDFIESFGFKHSETTGQTNNHISIVDLFERIKQLNTTVTNLSENVRLGILLGEITQIPREGQVGSSVMPQKVNPWRFESGEGNLEKSSRLIDGLADGLIKTQLERDSSDHPWERGYGEMLGMSLAGLSYIDENLKSIEVNKIKTTSDLKDHYEILAEPLQIAGRMEGDQDSYMKIKAVTQGKQLDKKTYEDLVMKFIKDPQRRTILLNLTPDTYVGRAPVITHETVNRYNDFRQKIERGILDDSHAIDAVLFDFDGTLQIGDKDALFAQLSAINTGLNLGFSDEQIIEFGRRSDYSEMRRMMVEAFNASNPQNSTTEEEFQAENDKVTGKFDHLIRLAENTKEVLEALRKSGKRMGIVTTRGAQSFNRLLESHGIKEYFEVVITKSDLGTNGRRKPHPEPIARALEIMRIPASNRVLYVGDKQEDDIIAGNALGLKTALVPSDDEHDPYGAKPTYKLRDIKDLQRRFGR